MSLYSRVFSRYYDRLVLRWVSPHIIGQAVR